MIIAITRKQEVCGLQTYSSPMFVAGVLEPNHPQQQQPTKRVVQGEYLRTDRVEPDKMGETEYATREDGAWDITSNPAGNVMS